MRHTIKSIADALEASAFGALDFEIGALAEPQMAGPEDLALATNPKYAEALEKGQARAALLWDGADWQALGLEAAIVVKRPRYAMSGLTAMMDPGQGFASGIHPTAIIDENAQIGENVSVGAYSIIARDARIGANTMIGPQSYVGTGSSIGANSLIREQVSIGANATIGDRFIAQPGVRVGGDGLSFVTIEKSGVEAVRETLGDQGDTEGQPWHRIHSLGGVVIGDDVELGANATIDMGTIRPTRVGNGTKIDNLVQLGHNVVVGRDCLLCGQVGVAGSAVIGNNVVMGGQAGVGDNITIGDRVVLGGATKAMTSVPAGRVMLGYPATKMQTQVESYKALRRLPRVLRDVAALKKAVFKDGSSD
ncbi:MAG: UDP-3-O-(3-hydroxymyristoyl)glucosamine N-acyltransferase [Pseudomonadota bacterium]